MNFDILAWVSLLIIVCDLYLLGATRLPRMIRAVAVLGFLLSFLPLLFAHPAEKTHVVILVIISSVVKGVVIPRSLFKSIRGVRILNETRPVIGSSLSVVIGIVVAASTFFLLKRLPINSDAISPFHVATAVTTAFVGLYIIVIRRNVVGQIIGYLVFENAGFFLGVSVAASQPLFIEMGILLDILVGVFIMVIAANYVHMHHDTMSTTSLERLTH